MTRVHSSRRLPLTLSKNELSLVILLFTLVSFVTGLTALSYPFLLAISAIWIRSFTSIEFLLLSLFALSLMIIGIVNIEVIDNYLDLTWKGVYKLLLYAISALAYRNLFISASEKDLSKLRLAIWLSFIASLFVNFGFDLQSMQQMMVINILFMIELYAFIRGDTRLLFYAATFILLITTKKQLWFSALLFIYFLQPQILKRFFSVFIVAVIFVGIFGAVGVEKAGINTEDRASGFLSERFITPDPYGNMRLYLSVTLIPKLIEQGVFFGFGLERYGTTAAYESKRDIERTKLGMDDFVSTEYNPSSLFGSVAADVGFITILMQAGLAGLALYILMMWTVSGSLVNLTKGFLIILPYFLGGPIVYSVGLPILLGVTYGLINQHRSKPPKNKKTRYKHRAALL